MVTQLNRGTPAREILYEVVQYLAARLTLSGADTFVKVGTLPTGSVLLNINTRVITAISGGTPVLGVGTTSTNIGGTGDIATGISVATGSVQTFPLAALAMPFTAPQDVFVGTSGGSTAGDTVVVVAFVKPLA
jgi:hypothetical protein